VEELEQKILDLLKDNLMSVSQIANKLNIRKDVAAAYLESLRQQGKLELFEVGKSKVYILPRRPLEVKKPRIIGIVSGKGGVGKTVISINLTAALNYFGKNAIALDGDVKTSGLGLQLGMYYFPITLNDVVKNDKNILSAIYIHPSGLRIIPASLSIEQIQVSALSKFINLPYFENSILIVDSPPGLEDIREILSFCEEIIFVTLPEIPSVANIFKLQEICKEFNVKPLGIIVNRYKKDKHEISIREIERVCELPILGVIPEDKIIKKSIYKKYPSFFLNPYSRSSLEFKKIAAKLLGFNFKPSLTSKIKGLFYGLGK